MRDIRQHKHLASIVQRWEFIRGCTHFRYVTVFQVYPSLHLILSSLYIISVLIHGGLFPKIEHRAFSRCLCLILLLTIIPALYGGILVLFFVYRSLLRAALLCPIRRLKGQSDARDRWAILDLIRLPLGLRLAALRGMLGWGLG